jgi:anti-sigma-K factor RskA
MNYADPRLRKILAGEYVLGTLPRRARARFERLMEDDAALARLTDEWAEHFASLDAAMPGEEPPARVWRGIEARIAPSPQATSVASPRPRWFDRLALWRGLAIGAAAAAAALVVYIAVLPSPTEPQVIAVLVDQSGQPAWVATSGPSHRVAVAAILPPVVDQSHALELWAVAGGLPRPLGLLATTPGERLILPSGAVPRAGGTLAISLEPPGGSPTGQPTGPILYQGRILSDGL